MTYYGRWTYKYEEAARQGAAGVLIVHETGPEVTVGGSAKQQYRTAEGLPPGDAYIH